MARICWSRSFDVLWVLAFILSATVKTLACEGECIVGITKAFLGNYSIPVHGALSNIASQISDQLLPPSRRPNDPIVLVEGIFTAYANASYDSLENAIFPSYFHGKCQRFSKDGQDPPGCPNPDCPVVCGTPGSLVHFYPTLRLIAFNDTRNTLQNIVRPGSPAFNQILQQVSDARQGSSGNPTQEGDLPLGNFGDEILPLRRWAASFKRDSGFSHPSFHHRAVIHRHSRSVPDSPSINASLTQILKTMDSLLSNACGGNINDGLAGLPRCSWESAMKGYILSFP